MKKKILFILVLLFSFLILHEIYHISLVIIYGFPANAFLLFFSIVFIVVKHMKNKYPILNVFIQLRLAFISMLIALSIVCFLSPFIILYSNKFEYILVLNCELELIKLRDKFISLTGLNWEVILVFFLLLMAFSFFVRKDCSIIYSTYANFVNNIIVFLFILTSFSLTSHYFVANKANNIYHDLTLESQELDKIILDSEKFLLSCRIIQKAFKTEDFQLILAQENLYDSIKKDSTNASKMLASYFSNYFNSFNITSNSYCKKSISKNEYSHSKLLEIKTKNSTKVSKIVFLKAKQNYVKSNTINLLTDILNKMFQTQQTALVKIFANSLINDLNNKLSYELIAFTEKNKSSIIKKLNTYKFQLYLTKLSFRKTFVNNYKINYTSFMQKYKIPRIKPKFRWFKFRFR